MVELKENKNYAEPIKNYFHAFYCKECGKLLDFEEVGQKCRIDGVFGMNEAGLIVTEDIKEQFDLQEGEYIHYFREDGVMCSDVERVEAETLEKLEDKLIEESL